MNPEKIPANLHISSAAANEICRLNMRKIAYDAMTVVSQVVNILRRPPQDRWLSAD
ncbi:MAG: hypothetical protein HY360_24050 [Verrucomicrobia bacterium]|nr:hypothetical protein [Verrucomicrobiota bacterium]